MEDEATTDTLDAAAPGLPWRDVAEAFDADPLRLELARARARERMFAEPRAVLRLGRYVVLERLGRGAMGVVYAAFDPQLDRKVAIKLLVPGRGDAEAQARLLREAQAMARLSHPNVVAVHDVGEHEGRVYVAMEFVQGESLGAWIERVRPGWRDVLAMFVQAARGLQAAHEAGLVHRDFKPDNVLIRDATEPGRRARAMVTDFGLARASFERDTSEPAPTSAPLQIELTQEGTLIGTPGYMAPEQFAGTPTDARTDQFAFCIALWEAAYGERPFGGDSINAIALSVTAGVLREPRRSDVPRWLRRVLTRGLAVDPNLRWPAMDALLDALERGQSRVRWRTAGVAVVALGLAWVGGLAWQGAQRAGLASACEEAGASIDAVWPGVDDGARVEQREHLLATGLGYAAATADRVEPWLDDYATRWRDARTQACRQHDVERVRDDDLDARAQECLEERRGALEAFLQQLRDADATTVQTAITAAISLPPVDACTDEVALRRRPALPADAVDEVKRIRAALAHAGALQDAGKPAESVRATEAALAEADALGWAPLRARARAALGAAIVEEASDDARAERALVQAYVEAGATDASDVALDTATRLVTVVGVRLAREREGRLWGRLAQLELDRSGAAPDGISAGALLNSRGMLEFAAGDYLEAKALHEQALAIRESLMGSEHLAVVVELGNLANAHEALGDYATAKALGERALAIREAALGPEHPDVASSLNNLANVHFRMGEYAQAKALHERSLAIRERAYGVDHPRVAMSLGNLANVHEALGEYEQARALHERALAIRETTFGPDHPQVAMSLSNLANVYEATGAESEAKALQTRALAILEKVHGPDHPDVASTLASLANLDFVAGDFAKARAGYERALAILEKALGPEHPNIALALQNLAITLEELGEYEQAMAMHERALGIRERALGKDHPTTAMGLVSLADAERLGGAYAKAEPHYRRALSIYATTVEPDNPTIAFALVGLGENELALRRADDAIPLFERALAIREAHETPSRDLVSARFGLAKALRAAKRDDRRATELAAQAATALRSEGPEAQRQLATIERWLSHGK